MWKHCKERTNRAKQLVQPDTNTHLEAHSVFPRMLKPSCEIPPLSVHLVTLLHQALLVHPGWHCSMRHPQSIQLQVSPSYGPKWRPERPVLAVPCRCLCHRPPYSRAFTLFRLKSSREIVGGFSWFPSTNSWTVMQRAASSFSLCRRLKDLRARHTGHCSTASMMAQSSAVRSSSGYGVTPCTSPCWSRYRRRTGGFFPFWHGAPRIIGDTSTPRHSVEQGLWYPPQVLVLLGVPGLIAPPGSPPPPSSDS